MEKDIVNRRLVIGAVIILFSFLFIILKLTYIQVYKHKEYNELAIKQRSTEIEVDASRGFIYDRNLKALTNNSSTPTIIVPKVILEKDEDLFNKVLVNSSLSHRELLNMMKNEEFAIQTPLNYTFDISDYSNVFIVDIINRYDTNNLLSHVIGYVNEADNRGQYGIEKVYDEILNDRGKNSVFLEYDDRHSLLIGTTEFVDDTNKPMDPAGVRTRVDINIQSYIESVMDKKRINGSVIVTEVATGDILGIASRPNFNQEQIQEYLENRDMTLYNKSIQVGYPPGSIFKIVVLLAALEDNSDVIHEDFICNGHESVGNLKINCSGVHNHINLKDAFSKSCNSTFIQMGKKIGSKKILDMARKLNFEDKINIGLIEEISGTLPTKEESIGPAIGNISIGQGEIEATPLQISNLLMIIANDGIQKQLKLIEGISNDSGELIIKGFNYESDKRVISQEHTDIAKDYLIEVVKNGTGRRMDLDMYGSAGGKTGTAQAIADNREILHGWFAGFFPANNPKYVVTVLVEGGGSGSTSAAPIFEEICKYLYEMK